MGWLVIIVGVVLILVVVRDIFHTLGHPEGQGGLSRRVLGTFWKLSRCRAGRGRLARLVGPLARLVGPLALLAVIIAWGTLAVIGWALLYWPFIPEGFVYVGGDAAGRNNSALDALHLSLVAISTLGIGDIAPASGWLRIATPLEAVFGFALFTVAVSWVLQIYPALTRRRVLAIRLTLLRRMDTLGGLRDVDSAMVAGMLDGLATGIVQARVDLSEYSETYYFRDDDPSTSLAATVGYAAQLGEAGATSRRADVRLAAGLLVCALADFASVLDGKFLHLGGSVPELLDAYATDHGHMRS